MTESVDPSIPILTAQQQESYAGVFRLLACLWIREIDLPVLESVSSGGLSEAYVAAGGYIPDSADAATVEQLSIEYCACFLGPKNHLPPHQSIVTSSRFQAECVDSMKSWCDIIEGAPPQISEQNILDHAGVQLNLAATICESIAKSEPANLATLQALQSQFFREHIIWISEYCGVAMKQSASPFYTGVFKVTARFVDEIQRSLFASIPE